MKIGIDVSQIVYGTGVSRYTQELVRHLLRLDKKNEYLLFAGVWRQRKKIDGFFKILESEGLSFVPKISLLPPRIADLAFNRLRVPIEVFTGRLDLFHASNWTTPRTQAKLVTTVHDLTPLLYPEAFPKSLVKNFKRNLELVSKTADLVLADCEATKKDLLKYTSFSTDQIKTVYLAAGSQFKPVKDEAELKAVNEKYQIGGRFILSVGTKEPRKNIKRLLKAFNQIDDRRVSLVLVGRYGWGEESGIKGQGSRIVETGFIDDKDLPALYSAAAAFVYPSLYEGFGLPVLEAMQCGCPVITSDRSATAEIAGQAGLLIDPTDVKSLSQAISKVLTSQPIRKNLVSEGLKRTQQFSWEKTARETLDAYQEVAQK